MSKMCSFQPHSSLFPKIPHFSYQTIIPQILGKIVSRIIQRENIGKKKFLIIRLFFYVFLFLDRLSDLIFGVYLGAYIYQFKASSTMGNIRYTITHCIPPIFLRDQPVLKVFQGRVEFVQFNCQSQMDKIRDNEILIPLNRKQQQLSFVLGIRSLLAKQRVCLIRKFGYLGYIFSYLVIILVRFLSGIDLESLQVFLSIIDTSQKKQYTLRNILLLSRKLFFVRNMLLSRKLINISSKQTFLSIQSQDQSILDIPFLIQPWQLSRFLQDLFPFEQQTKLQQERVCYKNKSIIVQIAYIGLSKKRITLKNKTVLPPSQQYQCLILNKQYWCFEDEFVQVWYCIRNGFLVLYSHSNRGGFQTNTKERPLCFDLQYILVCRKERVCGTIVQLVLLNNKSRE
eukprot:TRINITY_DN636_c0_g2_i9.p1 TRINITY_DN636_c0_g2~~TRINITY_DN636_c0_g2_i9.p1  ORF type:complete len:398 (-),score=-10.16 TRINITY_DN636_c0_g2_i9:674-1867(-)